MTCRRRTGRPGDGRDGDMIRIWMDGGAVIMQVAAGLRPPE